MAITKNLKEDINFFEDLANYLEKNIPNSKKLVKEIRQTVKKNKDKLCVTCGKGEYRPQIINNRTVFGKKCTHLGVLACDECDDFLVSAKELKRSKNNTDPRDWLAMLGDPSKALENKRRKFLDRLCKKLSKHYNEDGVYCWFIRPYFQSSYKAPMESFPDDWTPSDASIRNIIETI